MVNCKEAENKKIFSRLISLVLAQIVLLSFSMYWMVKYYHRTLMLNLDFYQAFSALGTIGKVSFVVLLAIVVIILYAVFLKRNRKASVTFLCALFSLSVLFFILERLYEIYFMYITVLIVARTFVWANLFLLACVSGIGLIFSILILIQASSHK